MLVRFLLLFACVYCAFSTEEFLTSDHRLFREELSEGERAEAFLEWSRSQLQTSTWPVDHGDSARSKYVMDAGFPADVRVEDIKIQLNSDFRSIQWLYTGGKNSEWVYAMSGDSLNGYWVSKVNSTTLEIVQRYKLQNSFYTGGMIIHRNDHVYAIHSNNLYTFWNGDLANVTWKRLPTELNGGATLTNGMLVTHDGYLLVKQFSFHINDMGLIKGSKKAASQIHNALIIISIVSSFFFFNKYCFKRFSPVPQKILVVAASLIFGYYLGCALAVSVFIGMLHSSLGSLNWLRFVTDGWISPNFGGGELKLIDPITLEVKVSAQLPERCSFARMALSTEKNPDDGVLEDVIILLGDENVHQFRWRPSEESLYWVPVWSRRYRKNNDGTFPGTGPSIYHGMTYFTDNTFPVPELADNTYTFFAASIHHIPPSIPDKTRNRKIPNYAMVGRPITKEDYLLSTKIPAVPSSWGYWSQHLTQNNEYPLLPYDPILPFSPTSSDEEKHPPQAGYMFWSSVINPAYGSNTNDNDKPGSVIVWDTARAIVQARDLIEPSKILWQMSGVSNSDCITVIPDRYHVYLTDYGAKAPRLIKDWLAAVAGDIPHFRSNDKYFIVADTKTGRVQVNITLPELGVNPTLLVPGKHNDVFIGAQKGLIRIYADRA